jgi:thiol-disulfide isomerase/thioredoxin
MLLIVTTVNAEPNIEVENDSLEPSPAEFTHTVFAEECTATWCPNCPIAAEALYNIYDSGDYPFYYVSLVNDMNDIAKARNREYSFGFYKIWAYPTVYFDGGSDLMVGRGSDVAQTETAYRDLIEQEGARIPTRSITMDSTVSWDGNAKITVTINIKNNGLLPYFGKLRSYVTEIESRWNDNVGNPYHFALLDYAVNKYILLWPGVQKTITGTFDGTQDHGGQTYEDLAQENTMVISALFHWFPHFRQGYEGQDFTQIFFAHYVDQATAAIPT